MIVKISSMVEKVAGLIEAQSLQAEYGIGFKCASMIIEAGLKDDFLKFFRQGKAAWSKAWTDLKDSTKKTAIKSLRTGAQIKDFILKNPGLKLAVISAMLLGQLAMPPDASAEMIPQMDAHSFASQMHPDFSSGQMKVLLPQGWAEQVLLWSMKGKSFKEGDYSYLLDMKTNISNIVKDRFPNTPSGVLDAIISQVEGRVGKILDKFGVGAVEKAKEIGIDIGGGKPIYGPNVDTEGKEPEPQTQQVSPEGSGKVQKPPHDYSQLTQLHYQIQNTKDPKQKALLKERQKDLMEEMTHGTLRDQLVNGDFDLDKGWKPIQAMLRIDTGREKVDRIHKEWLGKKMIGLAQKANLSIEDLDKVIQQYASFGLKQSPTFMDFYSMKKEKS